MQTLFLFIVCCRTFEPRRKIFTTKSSTENCRKIASDKVTTKLNAVRMLKPIITAVHVAWNNGTSV